MIQEDESTFNHPQIPQKQDDSVVVGIEDVCKYVQNLVVKKMDSSRKNCLLAIDGHPGVEFQNIVEGIAKSLMGQNLYVEIVGFDTYYKSSSEIEEIIKPLLTWDASFGRVFDGDLEDFLDKVNLRTLKRKMRTLRREEHKTSRSPPEVLICFGCGAANEDLRSLYDFVLYIDLTREEFINRARKDGIIFLISPNAFEGMSQVADVGLPLHLFKLSNYVYYPVLEKYKQRLLPNINFYIDGNIRDKPKLVTQHMFDRILSLTAQYPVRLKPLYIPSPWGGQWIKEIRKLPEAMVNCAWSFEAVTLDMSLRIAVGKTFLEIPFLTFLLKESKRVMGSSATKRFNHFFPIRVHYDDSMEGGNMALQVHPPTSYVKKNFNEEIGQDESYYIVLTGEGSKVYLGLKEGVDKEEFYEEARKAEKQGVTLDYDKYVNSISTKPGDFFLIPSGTVHASGRNQVVLEIGNNYGYTFHIYDYLRPDLSGGLRPIHLNHAFKVIKSNRTASWVKQHLRQEARLVRSGEDWSEYLVGELEEIYYVAYRLEFEREIEDNTRGSFHILTLIEGDEVVIRSKEHPERQKNLVFSETVIVPACIGRYSIINLANSQCKVLKVLLRE